MSIETGDLTVPAHEATRPLPPEVTFNAATATFSGKAEPAKTVRLTDSIDQKMRTATADANGDWEIALNKAPHWYTSYEIWVCDGQDRESSEKVKFTFGGNNPKLSDVYASQTLVFGRATPGVKVVVFGPQGQVLGRALALDKCGVWTVRFDEVIEAGKKVCVLAQSFVGNTSMPHFAEVETFSVKDRNVGHIAGAGAEPGEQIQLYDTKTDQFIASTTADKAGTFEFSFCDPLDAGIRISLQRTRMDGTTLSGPVFTTHFNDCQPPVITIFSGEQLAGKAAPGLKVTYAQIRDGETVYSDTVTAAQNGLWSSDDAIVPHAFDFQPGDILTATAKSTDGTQESLISSNVTFSGARPGIPLLDNISSNSADGWAEPKKFVVATTRDQGVIALAEVGDLGRWQLDWTDTVGALSSETVVTFEACTSVLPSDIEPNSMTTASYADILAAGPPVPVIVKYTTTDIAGTETVPTGTSIAVVVHNNTKGEDVKNSGGVLVVDGIWEVIVDPADPSKPDGGDEIVAIAWFLDAMGNQTVDSGPSTPKLASSFVPPRPIVDVKYPDDIEGTEFIIKTEDQNITSVNIAPELDISRTPVGNSRLAGTAWAITPAVPRTPGENMVAWAVTDAGAKSEETPFTIVPAVKPLPPIIGNWQSPKITGAGVPGYIVTLYVNDTLAGTTTVDEYRDWEFELPGTPPNTTKLKATTNENVANAPVSDPFYITVGQPRATLKIDATSVTTSGFSGTTTDLPQIVQGWRLSDGLKVVDVPVASNPIVGTYLSGSNIKSGDVIKFISQNDMGDPEDSFSIFHGNVVN